MNQKEQPKFIKPGSEDMPYVDCGHPDRPHFKDCRFTLPFFVAEMAQKMREGGELLDYSLVPPIRITIPKRYVDVHFANESEDFVVVELRRKLGKREMEEYKEHKVRLAEAFPVSVKSS
jgi:hypothetical protein